jgi:hypothetical protein
MPYLTISLFNWRELMPASCAARLTLPLLRVNFTPSAHPGKISVGGGNHPGVGLQYRFATDPAEGTILQHLQ